MKIAFRLQMFYGGEEASSITAKGPYHAVKEPHQYLLQEHPCFSRYVQFYHGLNLLQEAVVFLQEGAVFLQESADFLQEGRTFYRKLCVYRKLPVEVWDGQKFVSNEDLAAEEWVGCMHATVGTPEHCCYLAPPSSSPCNQDPCTSKPDQ